MPGFPNSFLLFYSHVPNAGLYNSYINESIAQQNENVEKYSTLILDDAQFLCLMSS